MNSFKDVIERVEDGTICHIRCVEQQKQIQAREMQLKLEREREELEKEQGRGGEGEGEGENQAAAKTGRQIVNYDDNDDDLFAGIMEDD